MSDTDIHAGVKWSLELNQELQTCNIGILCLTPENIDSRWMIFEAGALSKIIETSRVIPYRLQFGEIDVCLPLSQFQGIDTDKAGSFKLVRNINEALGKPLADQEKLRNIYEKWWPDLERELKEIPPSAIRKIRSDRELLEEILEIARKAGIRVLNERLGQILLIPNVTRIEVKPKEKSGQTSEQLAILANYCWKKVANPEDSRELIPTDIFGMPTDVVEEPL